MNLISIFARFPDQQSCMEHLEQLRWGDEPSCPHCRSGCVGRKADGDRLGRFNCYDCKSSFNVLSGTIFEKTKLPLQKWFLAIGLIVKAKKSLSSHQLARDLELNQKSAWFMQRRIRAQMAGEQGSLLQSILEVDETYSAGSRGRPIQRQIGDPRKERRGTNKIKVLGVMERGGRVAAQVSACVNGKNIFKIANLARSLLISDEYTAYNVVRPVMAHRAINNSSAYVNGDIHTNSIECFWALIKRVCYSSYYYKDQYAPLFIAESVRKYNERNNLGTFCYFLKGYFQ